MKKIHLIMPMGGKGSRFSKEGYDVPKPLIQIHGKPFFYWACQSIVHFVDVCDIIFVVLQEHVDKYHIDQEIRNYYKDAKIKIIPEMFTEGPVLTCLAGLEEVHDDNPILFNDCDHIFCCNSFNEWCKEGNFDAIDGALLTFQSKEDKYSYVMLDENDNVTGTVEKKVVSNDAICGAYYLKNATLFKEMSQIYFKECSYNEYFVSGVYNVMAEQKKNMKKFTVDFHVAFGTPEEYKDALTSDKFEELI